MPAGPEGVGVVPHANAVAAVGFWLLLWARGKLSEIKTGEKAIDKVLENFIPPLVTGLLTWGFAHTWLPASEYTFRALHWVFDLVQRFSPEVYDRSFRFVDNPEAVAGILGFTALFYLWKDVITRVWPRSLVGTFFGGVKGVHRLVFSKGQFGWIRNVADFVEKVFTGGFGLGPVEDSLTTLSNALLGIISAKAALKILPWALQTTFLDPAYKADVMKALEVINIIFDDATVHTLAGIAAGVGVLESLLELWKKENEEEFLAPMRRYTRYLRKTKYESGWLHREFRDFVLSNLWVAVGFTLFLVVMGHVATSKEALGVDLQQFVEPSDVVSAIRMGILGAPILGGILNIRAKLMDIWRQFRQAMDLRNV